MAYFWRDFRIRETGTGQQVAQFHDIYDNDDVDCVEYLGLTSGQPLVCMCWAYPLAMQVFSMTVWVTARYINWGLQKFLTEHWRATSSCSFCQRRLFRENILMIVKSCVDVVSANERISFINQENGTVLVFVSRCCLFQRCHCLRLWCRKAGWLMNDGFERMCKKAVVVYSCVLFRHWPGGTERNNEASVRVVSVAALLLADLIS
jgi:hypothetical protein